MIPLNYTADLSKPIVIPVDLKPRYRDSDMAHIAADSTVAFLVVEVDWKPWRKSLQPISTRSCPSRRLRRTAEMGVDSGPSGVMSQRRGCADSRPCRLDDARRDSEAERLGSVDGVNVSFGEPLDVEEG
jgi:hypothetical protein